MDCCPQLLDRGIVDEVVGGRDEFLISRKVHIADLQEEISEVLLASDY
jgi:hypothetical protein